MIQRYLKDELEQLLPDLKWTIDYYTGKDHTGTVHSEGGRTPDTSDTKTRYPSYMVYIRSSNFDYAKTAANQVHDALHCKEGFNVSVNQYDMQNYVIGVKSYHVFFMRAVSEPQKIGVQDGKMDYSINFDVTLIENKEEL